MKDCASPHLPCANKELVLACPDFSLDQRGVRTEATEMCSPTLAQQRESGHWRTICDGFCFYKIYRIVFFSGFGYHSTKRNIKYLIYHTISWFFLGNMVKYSDTRAMAKEDMIRFNRYKCQFRFSLRSKELPWSVQT